MTLVVKMLDHSDALDALRYAFRGGYHTWVMKVCYPVSILIEADGFIADTEETALMASDPQCFLCGTELTAANVRYDVCPGNGYPICEHCGVPHQPHEG